MKTDQFKNDGFGWYCVSCAVNYSANHDVESRLMYEGEAESKQPVMAEPARAKWSNADKSVLECPICGISEVLSD